MAEVLLLRREALEVGRKVLDGTVGGSSRVILVSWVLNRTAAGRRCFVAAARAHYVGRGELLAVGGLLGVVAHRCVAIARRLIHHT